MLHLQLEEAQVQKPTTTSILQENINGWPNLQPHVAHLSSETRDPCRLCSLNFHMLSGFIATAFVQQAHQVFDPMFESSQHQPEVYPSASYLQGGLVHDFAQAQSDLWCRKDCPL